MSYYVLNVAPKDFLFDSASIAINDRIAQLPDDADVSQLGIDPALTKAMRDGAPVYRALWWPSHRDTDERWVAQMRGRLAAHGKALAQRISASFQACWPRTPIPVDVSAYAGWAGAYTTEHPSHIIISSTLDTNEGDAGLESLFHEALHTMDSTVNSAITASGDRAGVRMPYDVTHALIFFTAGSAVEQEIPGYHSPFAGTVWQRAPFLSLRPHIVTDWLPYLNGATRFSQSVDRLVDDLTPLMKNPPP